MPLLLLYFVYYQAWSTAKLVTLNNKADKNVVLDNIVNND